MRTLNSMVIYNDGDDHDDGDDDDSGDDDDEEDQNCGHG